MVVCALVVMSVLAPGKPQANMLLWPPQCMRLLICTPDGHSLHTGRTCGGVWQLALQTWEQEAMRSCLNLQAPDLRLQEQACFWTTQQSNSLSCSDCVQSYICCGQSEDSVSALQCCRLYAL